MQMVLNFLIALLGSAFVVLALTEGYLQMQMMRHCSPKGEGQFRGRRWALQSDPDEYDDAGRAYLGKAAAVELAILVLFPILFILAAMHR